jgi:hypothetical protein
LAQFPGRSWSSLVNPIRSSTRFPTFATVQNGLG